MFMSLMESNCHSHNQWIFVLAFGWKFELNGPKETGQLNVCNCTICVKLEGNAHFYFRERVRRKKNFEREKKKERETFESVIASVCVREQRVTIAKNIEEKTPCILCSTA